jgi:hypothetical protein
VKTYHCWNYFSKFPSSPFQTVLLTPQNPATGAHFHAIYISITCPQVCPFEILEHLFFPACPALLILLHLIIVTIPGDDDRVLRRIFGPKRDEVTGGWRKLHNKELHGLYCSPSIVRVIKARRMRWAGHVARMGEVRGTYNILVWEA